MRSKKFLLSVLLLQTIYHCKAQRFLTDMMDTTTIAGKNIYSLYSQYDRLRFGGYMQPQFQWIESKGAKTFNGGDFASNSDNRFMLRRGRLRIDYMHFNEKNQVLAVFAFQFDGTERGVAIRDFWGRIYENHWGLFSLTTGMFGRPMGYEVNLSSAERESPERGRMSQTLMKTERDIGVMISIESRKKKIIPRFIKLDIGLFNGQGLSGTTDYDNHKDIIGRLTFKPQKIASSLLLSGGISVYYGGINSVSPWVYSIKSNNGNPIAYGDSSAANVNNTLPRKYYGADMQLKIPNKVGFTEVRAEYIMGKQTATAGSSETPGFYPVSSSGNFQPLYVRNFDGAYFYFLQHLGSNRWQLVLKYDWYDPNKKVKGKEIGKSGNFTPADMRYDTFGAGIVCYLNAHVKTTVYYEKVWNESTTLAGYEKDLKDNIFTCRIQYRF